MSSRLTRGWNDFWYRPINAEPMGLFRILYALILLGHWLPRMPYVPELYSREGWHSPYLWYTWGYDFQPPPVFFAYLVYFILLVSTTFFLVGWQTRLSNFVLLVSYVYLALVESNNIKAYDRILILEGIAMLVAFPGAALSLDAFRSKNRMQPVDLKKQITSPRYGIQLFLLLFCAVYFFAGLKKAFFIPHWWDGGVLLYALLDRRNAVTTLGVFLTQYPEWVTFLARVTVIWEMLFPLMMLSPRTRLCWLFGGVLFHLGIQATIDVGPFNLIMMATYLTFLPLPCYERWRNLILRHLPLARTSLLGLFFSLGAFLSFIPEGRTQDPFESSPRFIAVSLSDCSNADYHHNPFILDPASGKDLFPALMAGTYQWNKVPFQILEPYGKTQKASVITTGEDPYFSCSLPLIAKPSRAVHLAVDGAWIKGTQDSRIARLEVYYRSGNREEKIVFTNRDVWTYKIEPWGLRIPREAVLWQSDGGQKIVVLTIPLNRKEIPESLNISTMPAEGIRQKQPALAIFAVTQELEP